MGNFWYHHVAAGPESRRPSGMSSFGRWMYGPWFWPPQQDIKNGPIANPYFDPSCDPNTADFCEPELIPGTPNISVGMEQFNDTPIVNGTAYPTTTLIRRRIGCESSMRRTTASGPAVVRGGLHGDRGRAEGRRGRGRADRPGRLPDAGHRTQPAGPSWIQIGTEGGFLPAPVVVPNQPTTWITDPTRFDVGNVDQHSLLLAPAEQGGRDRRLLEVRGQDADPLQRRAGGIPGQDRLLRLLHGRPRPEAGLRAEHPARVRAEHPHDHAGQDPQRVGQGVRPQDPADGLQPQGERHGRIRGGAAPDRRRAGPTTRPTARASRRAGTARRQVRPSSATGSSASISRVASRSRSTRCRDRSCRSNSSRRRFTTR